MKVRTMSKIKNRLSQDCLEHSAILAANGASLNSVSRTATASALSLVKIYSLYPSKATTIWDSCKIRVKSKLINRLICLRNQRMPRPSSELEY